MATETGTELFGSTYRRGEVVFRQGDTGNAMYIIQSGAVEVSQQNKGRETVIAILEKGDFFGEMALLQNEFRSATITAISRTRLIPLTKDLFVDRLKRDPDVSLHLLKKLIQRILHAHRRFRQELLENEAFRNAVAIHSEEVLTGGRGTPAEETDVIPAIKKFTDDFLASQSPESTNRHRHHAALGETIFREGETGNCMYLILEGSVGICKDEAHDAQLIDTIGPGDFFGEMALIADIPRSATVKALEPTELIVIDKKQFAKNIENQPELAIAIIKTLILRLSCLEKMLSEPSNFRVQQRSPWMPRFKKPDRISLSIVSLSTCAGCSAILLDHAVLSEILARASIDYCQMLMDREDLPESDVILIDGVVRLREDQRRLSEARRRCRHLVAWGTCAAFSGIPGLVNRFEVETVIEESYGAADDAFSYYFCGAAGIDPSSTYQLNGIELQRRAFAIDSFEKVDYYLPGCPPDPSLLLDLLNELTGMPVPKTAPVVCSRCGRKRLKKGKEAVSMSNTAVKGNDCFNSSGGTCLGFMTRGGCDAICPKNGVPCWGCRGPSKKSIKGLQAGETMEEIASQGFRQRFADNDGRMREAIKRIKQHGHFMFNMDSDAAEKLLRAR